MNYVFHATRKRQAVLALQDLEPTDCRQGWLPRELNLMVNSTLNRHRSRNSWKTSVWLNYQAGVLNSFVKRQKCLIHTR